VITEVTLRLYAIPSVDRTFAVRLEGGEREMASLIRAIIASPLTPYAVLLLNASAAHAARLGERPVCLIRFGGNDAAVRAQVNALSQIARIQELETEVWMRIRQLDGHAHTTIRVVSLPQRFLAASARILGETVPGIHTCIDPRRGVLRIIVGGVDYADGDGGTSLMGGSPELQMEGADASEVIFEKLPAEVWREVSPTVVSDQLSQGIKRAFDPHSILNPGILGD